MSERYWEPDDMPKAVLDIEALKDWVSEEVCHAVSSLNFDDDFVFRSGDLSMPLALLLIWQDKTVMEIDIKQAIISDIEIALGDDESVLSLSQWYIKELKDIIATIEQKFLLTRGGGGSNL